MGSKENAGWRKYGMFWWMLIYGRLDFGRRISVFSSKLSSQL